MQGFAQGKMDSLEMKIYVFSILTITALLIRDPRRGGRHYWCDRYLFLCLMFFQFLQLLLCLLEILGEGVGTIGLIGI
jgi:hypothetical protein